MAQFLAQIDGWRTLNALDDVIVKYRVSRDQLQIILVEAQTLERGVNVSKTLSTTANVVGQTLLLTPEFPLGLVLLVGSGLLSLGTYFADQSSTQTKLDELVRSVQSAEQAMGNLQPVLVRLMYLHMVGHAQGVAVSQHTVDTIYMLLDRRMLTETGTGIDIMQFLRDVGSKIPAIWDTMGEAPGAVGGARVASAVQTVDTVRNVETRAAEIARIRQYYATIEGSGSTMAKAAAEVPGGLMSKAGGVLAVAGLAVDIGSTVYGWATTHPSVKRVEDEISKVDTLLMHLDNLRNDLVLAIAT